METNINENKSENRKYLKEISGKAKEMVDGENFRTINQVLIELFYKSKAHQTFKSLQDWNKEGFNIKKGSKPFPIWGKPIEAQSQEIEGETYTYYPLRFLFSNAQVWKGGVE
ncbi:MAG: hypothetical protein HYZ42_03770 [Bacteroidetes bacterium]|nr:hypothetical protein [Bacteroidota bacterium]